LFKETDEVFIERLLMLYNVLYPKRLGISLSSALLQTHSPPRTITKPPTTFTIHHSQLFGNSAVYIIVNSKWKRSRVIVKSRHWGRGEGGQGWKISARCLCVALYTISQPTFSLLLLPCLTFADFLTTK